VAEHHDDDPVYGLLKRLNKVRHESERLRARIDRLQNHASDERAGDHGSPSGDHIRSASRRNFSRGGYDLP